MRVVEIRNGERHIIRKGITEELASRVRACRQKVNKIRERDWIVEVEDESIHRTKKTPRVERPDSEEQTE